ncbi:MAG: MFS transporter [Rhodovarius sp.]|nr:MFS transporter [Rhodovarius sp.]
MITLPLQILALTLGHVFSNAVRTLPAVAADVLGRDLALAPEGLALVTGAFPLAFALAMIPVGVALDRHGARRVMLVLLGLGLAGALLAAAAWGPASMLTAQVVLGLACSGMLLAPMTFAARALSPLRFGLWSGIIQAIGNSGMLLSASPLAWLIEAAGWRAGFLACAVLAAVALLLVAAMVREVVPASPARRLRDEMRLVFGFAISPQLRSLMVLAFVSLAAVLGVRGLWGGPWLMEVKGLSRIEAGHLLLLAAAALVAGPFLAGLAARLCQHPVPLIAAGHLTAAACLGGLLLAAPFPSPLLDGLLLAGFGIAISCQVVMFALVRSRVAPEFTGRALSAQNMFFFGGAALWQAASGLWAAWGGPGGAIAGYAALLLLATLAFFRLERRLAAAAPG